MLGWLERALKMFTTDNRYHLLEREQVTAFVDAVALAMAIDRHIATEERDAIGELLERFEWPEGRPSEHIINVSVHRAWDVVADDEARAWDYCRDIAQRLGDDWLKENAYEACVRIVYADQSLEDAESLYLQQLAESFGLEADRVSHIEDVARAALEAQTSRTKTEPDAPLTAEELDDLEP